MCNTATPTPRDFRVTPIDTEREIYPLGTRISARDDLRRCRRISGSELRVAFPDAPTFRPLPAAVPVPRAIPTPHEPAVRPRDVLREVLFLSPSATLTFQRVVQLEKRRRARSRWLRRAALAAVMLALGFGIAVALGVLSLV